MESEILKMVISQGIFAALFVYLLFYVLRASDKREDRLILTLEKLAKKLNVVDDIKENLCRVEKKIDSNFKED